MSAQDALTQRLYARYFKSAEDTPTPEELAEVERVSRFVYDLHQSRRPDLTCLVDDGDSDSAHPLGPVQ